MDRDFIVRSKQISASKHLSSKDASALFNYSFEYDPEECSKLI